MVNIFSAFINLNTLQEIFSRPGFIFIYKELGNRFNYNTITEVVM